MQSFAAHIVCDVECRTLFNDIERRAVTFLSYFLADALRVALEVLDHLVDLAELTRDADVLRTMGFALPTLDAVIWLTVAGHHTIQRDEILATVLAIFCVANAHRQ